MSHLDSDVLKGWSTIDGAIRAAKTLISILRAVPEQLQDGFGYYGIDIDDRNGIGGTDNVDNEF